MLPIMAKPPITTPITTNNNGNGHSSYTCSKCHEGFQHKFELSLHMAAIHHSGKFCISM